jgi:iron-sulfur-dependent L-serine dehydratase single chain form
MEACAQRGMEVEGILPGGLKVRRRAPRLARKLCEQEPNARQDPLAALDWVTMWAMAVNEENAAGGRVVTAPTNGAAGVIPAIALYYLRFLCERMSDPEKEAGLLRYFCTAAAIGILYKENASISGAEVGCQGEVGVACSMAAGGLVAAQNGSNAQVEHAAEIAMEHSLGMTCDPIGGLVQIPCIERNGMGAVKAINASRVAMHERRAQAVARPVIQTHVPDGDGYAVALQGDQSGRPGAECNRVLGLRGRAQTSKGFALAALCHRLGLWQQARSRYPADGRHAENSGARVGVEVMAQLVFERRVPGVTRLRSY